MKFIVLGSGTSVPQRQRSAPAFWVETNSGSMLLDAGADAAHRMAEENLDWKNLDAIWISHFHLDHFGGLAPFLFGTKWAPQTRERRKPLQIFGPRGLVKLLRTFSDANEYGLLDQPFLLKLHEVEPAREFNVLADLRATTFSTPHTTESLAVRLTASTGKSLVYSSDTGFSQHLADFSRGVTLLVLECSFRRNKPVSTHLEIEEAIKIIRECNPQTALLTHLYPEWDDCNFAEEVSKLWSGEIIEAVDGLSLEL